MELNIKRVEIFSKFTFRQMSFVVVFFFICFIVSRLIFYKGSKRAFFDCDTYYKVLQFTFSSSSNIQVPHGGGSHGEGSHGRDSHGQGSCYFPSNISMSYMIFFYKGWKVGRMACYHSTLEILIDQSVVA